MLHRSALDLVGSITTVIATYLTGCWLTSLFLIGWIYLFWLFVSSFFFVWLGYFSASWSGCPGLWLVDGYLGMVDWMVLAWSTSTIIPILG